MSEPVGVGDEVVVLTRDCNYVPAKVESVAEEGLAGVEPRYYVRTEYGPRWFFRSELVLAADAPPPDRLQLRLLRRRAWRRDNAPALATTAAKSGVPRSGSDANYWSELEARANSSREVLCAKCFHTISQHPIGACSVCACTNFVTHSTQQREFMMWLAVIAPLLILLLGWFYKSEMSGVIVTAVAAAVWFIYLARQGGRATDVGGQGTGTDRDF